MNSICLIFSFRKNAKKTGANQSILQSFLLYLKRSVSQNFKPRNCKEVFPKRVYYWCNLLRWMFFIPCDNWKQYIFYTNLSFPGGLVQLRSMKQVFWRKSAFHVRYLRNNITMMLKPKVQKVYLVITFLLHSFILEMFHNFLYKWNFYNSKALWRYVFYYKSCNQVFRTVISVLTYYLIEER